MKKWVLILLMLLLTLPGYALITIEKKPGTGTLSGHLDDINANDLELDGKIDGKVSDDAFTADWGEVTDVAPSQAALYNYLINFDADGDGLFSDEAWFPSIFDPAAPGGIGGTTPGAGTFTDLTADTLDLTSVDGANRLTFPDNTTRSPAAGAQEIYSEGGLMKYSENGVEKNFITIDDTAGDGDTTVTLSADKIVEYIAAGGSGVPDGTSTDDILSWDGDSWEPIALTAHPAFSSLLTAFNNAGLNSFTFTPSVTCPIWAAISPVAVSFDVTDTSTTYAVADVDYQYDGTGGFVENMTNTTGDTWTAEVTISTDGAHTVQLEAVDNKSTPNSGQSAVYTINFDGTDPVVGTITPSSLTHDGTGATLTATVASITEANENNREWSLYDVTSAAIETSWTVFTGSSITGISIPTDQHTYRLDVRCTDLAGNAGSASSSNIVYSAGASVPDFQWNLDDNAASATILATYGGVNGVYYVNGSQTNTSTVHDAGTGIIKNPNYGAVSVGSSVLAGVLNSDGMGTVEFTLSGSGGPQTSTAAYLLMEGNSSVSIRRYTNSTTVRCKVVTTDYDFTVGNLEDGAIQKVRVVYNYAAPTGKLKLYQKTGEAAWVLRGSFDTMSLPNCGSTTYFYNSSSSGNSPWGSSTNNYYCGEVKFWNSVVEP